MRHRSSKRFSPARISAFLPHHSEWDISFTPQQDQTLHQIFKQPFHYLGGGVQSFAFVSQDGKYVLKFFKTPSTAKRKEKLISAFSAYRAAYQEFPEDTGLLFVHLTPTRNLQKTVMLIDSSGKKHLIDLDKTPFIIQEKAELIFDRFKRLGMKGDAEGLKRSVHAVFDLAQRRIQKGFTDDDKAVTHNYGFVGDRPIHFDIGRVHKGVREGEYETFVKRINTWLLEEAEE